MLTAFMQTHYAGFYHIPRQFATPSLPNKLLDAYGNCVPPKAHHCLYGIAKFTAEASS